MPKKKKPDPIVTIRLNQTGRPREDLSSLPVGWQDHILNMYKAGASDSEVKAEIIGWRGRFSDDLWYRWLKEEEEFGEIIHMGHILSEALFNKVGREQMKNPAFNANMFIFNMKNRFGWGDRGMTQQLPEQTSDIDYTKLSTETLKELISSKKNETENKS